MYGRYFDRDLPVLTSSLVVIGTTGAPISKLDEGAGQMFRNSDYEIVMRFGNFQQVARKTAIDDKSTAWNKETLRVSH